MNTSATYKHWAVVSIIEHVMFLLRDVYA